MKKILETKRLYLREMTDDDFDALKKVISDPINMKYYDKPYDDVVYKDGSIGARILIKNITLVYGR